MTEEQLYHQMFKSAQTGITDIAGAKASPNNFRLPHQITKITLQL